MLPQERRGYEILKEAGALEVSVQGVDPDAYDIAIIHLHVQAILERVAYASFKKAGLELPVEYRPGQQKSSRKSPFPVLSKKRLIRAGVRHISKGSLFEELRIYR